MNFNIWSHTSAYKYVPHEVGIRLRELYDKGEIKTQTQFDKELKSILGGEEKTYDS